MGSNQVGSRSDLRIFITGAFWITSFRYFGVPGNSRKLESFKYHLSQLWYKVLRRRSQRSKLNWERMERLIERWLPKVRVMHPYPDFQLYVNTRGRSPVR